MSAKKPGVILGFVGGILIGSFGLLLVAGSVVYFFSKEARKTRRVKQAEWVSHKNECYRPTATELVEKANRGERSTPREIQLFRGLCQDGLIVWSESNRRHEIVSLPKETEEKVPRRHLRLVG